MVNYDPSHKGDAPPYRMIIGTLNYDPGEYDITFYHQGKKVAGPVPVIVHDKTAEGEVSAPFNDCSQNDNNKILVLHVTAKWKVRGVPGPEKSGGAEPIKVRC